MKSVDQRCMGKEGTFRPAALARAGCEDEVSILNRARGRVVAWGPAAKLGIGCRSGSNRVPMLHIRQTFSAESVESSVIAHASAHLQ